VRARAQYRYVNREYTTYDGAWQPTREHRVEVGPEIEKNTAHQLLTFSVALGAGHMESLAQTGGDTNHSWVPVGSASA
jgi:hypothetical protein